MLQVSPQDIHRLEAALRSSRQWRQGGLAGPKKGLTAEPAGDPPGVELAAAGMPAKKSKGKGKGKGGKKGKSGKTKGSGVGDAGGEHDVAREAFARHVR